MSALPVPPLRKAAPFALILFLACGLSGCFSFLSLGQEGRSFSRDYYGVSASPVSVFGSFGYPLFIGSYWSSSHPRYYSRPSSGHRDGPRPRHLTDPEGPGGPRGDSPPRWKPGSDGNHAPPARHIGAQQRFSPDGTPNRASRALRPSPDRRTRAESPPERRLTPRGAASHGNRRDAARSGGPRGKFSRR
jgi:hypothetical protein